MGLSFAELPLIPDGDEAREWAERELARPEYADAQPTPLDRVAQAIGDFFEALFGGDAPPGLGNGILVGVAVLVVALIVVAFLVWGRPRAVRRATPLTAMLFGEDERRSASQLRADASDRAAAGDWTAAIVLRFRGLARGLQERGLVDLPPGATVHAFSRASARAFPAHAGTLDAAADAFDDVRYLRRDGTPALYAVVADADEAVAGARADPARLAMSFPAERTRP